MVTILFFFFFFFLLHSFSDMGFSKRGQVSPGPPTSPWPLPQDAMTQALLLPPLDQEILYHLAFYNSIFPKAKDVAALKLHTDMSPDMARILKEAGKFRKKGKHSPTLGCACFECYLSFWSRWSSSPNMFAISDILDIVDQHVLKDPSWQSFLSPAMEEKGGRAGRQKGKEPKVPNKKGKRTEESISIPASSAAAATSSDVVDDALPSGKDTREEIQDAAVADEGVKAEEPESNIEVRGKGLLDRFFKILWVD